VTIFNLPFLDYAPVFLVLSIVAGVLVSISYQNVASSLKARLFAQLPEPAVPKDAAKGSRDEVRAQLRSHQHALSRQEALSFALVYNNLFYLLFVVLLAFVIFKNLAPLYNYVLSVGVSAAAVMISSTTSKKSRRTSRTTSTALNSTNTSPMLKNTSQTMSTEKP